MANPTVGTPDYARSVGVIDANQILFNAVLHTASNSDTGVIDVTRWQSVFIGTPFVATAPYDLLIQWFSDANQTAELGRKFIGCGGSGNTDHVEATLTNRGPWIKVSLLTSGAATSVQLFIASSNRSGDKWSYSSIQFAGAGAGIYTIPFQSVPNGVSVGIDITDIYQGPANLSGFTGTLGTRIELYGVASDGAGRLVAVMPLINSANGDVKSIYVPPWHLKLFCINQTGAAVSMTASLVFGQ